MRSCVALLSVLLLVLSGCAMHVSAVSKGSIGVSSLPPLVTWDAEPVELQVTVSSPAADAIASELSDLLPLGGDVD